MLFTVAGESGGEHSFPSLELLRAPLLELVRQQVVLQDQLVRQQDVVAKELRVTNTYLRNGATSQFKYTSSQATQHRDPTFKSTLIQVRRGTSPQ
jgi:hypothetical protein